MKWHVYILLCSDGSLYTGVTSDITRRIRQHNGEITGGAKYTQHRRPVKCLYSENVSNRGAAQKREYEIKQLSREEKVVLCGGLA